VQFYESFGLKYIATSLRESWVVGSLCTIDEAQNDVENDERKVTSGYPKANENLYVARDENV